MLQMIASICFKLHYSSKLPVLFKTHLSQREYLSLSYLQPIIFFDLHIRKGRAEFVFSPAFRLSQREDKITVKTLTAESPSGKPPEAAEGAASFPGRCGLSALYRPAE